MPDLILLLMLWWRLPSYDRQPDLTVPACYRAWEGAQVQKGCEP